MKTSVGQFRRDLKGQRHGGIAQRLRIWETVWTFALALFSLLGVTTYAQVQQSWAAKYDGVVTNGTSEAAKIALDGLGNIVIMGPSQNLNSNLGYATIKYAPNGAQLWAQRYDTTNNTSARPARLAIDNSNNVVVTGSAVTIKYDSDGNQRWIAPYNGMAAAVDSSGNVYITGVDSNVTTVKLSPAGSNFWTVTAAESYPGPGNYSQAVGVDAAGNVYVCGSKEIYEYPGGNIDSTEELIKYGPNGNELWEVNGQDEGGALANPLIIEDFTVDLAGNSYSLLEGVGSDTVYTVFKHTSAGNVSWVKGNPTGDTASVAHGLVVSSTGSVTITGQNNYNYPDSSYGTYAISNNGASYVWSANYPEDPMTISVGTAIAVDRVGNVYVTGFSPGTNTGNDIVTIKYDTNGNQIWLQRYDGPAHGDDEGNAIAVDNNGNVYVAGYETVVGGGTEMVLIKYAPSFTLQRQSGGSVILQTQGSPGQAFDFQASTNLQSWVDLGTATADTNGVVQFDDTNAQFFTYRFYTTTPQ